MVLPDIPLNRKRRNATMKDHSKTEQGDRENGNTLTAVLRGGAEMLFAPALSAKVVALLPLSAKQQNDPDGARLVLNDLYLEGDLQAGGQAANGARAQS